jgi:serine/threonine protein kinase
MLSMHCPTAAALSTCVQGHAELNTIRLLRNHPNFTSFREVFQGEHCIHIAMDYYSASLPVYIKAQQNNLPRHDIKSIATQLLEGLAYMHENQARGPRKWSPSGSSESSHFGAIH